MKIRHAESFVKLDQKLTHLLYQIEDICGFELEITSSYREGDRRCHGRAQAVDIACDSSTRRMVIYDALRIVGIRRIGLYDKHVHCDTCSGMKFPQDVLWIGVSK